MPLYKTILFYIFLFTLGALLMAIFLWYSKNEVPVPTEEKARIESHNSVQVLDSLTSQATSSLSKQEEEKALHFLSSTSTEVQGNTLFDINSLEAR
jgi:hypothetical protein